MATLPSLPLARPTRRHARAPTPPGRILPGAGPGAAVVALAAAVATGGCAVVSGGAAPGGPAVAGGKPSAAARALDRTHDGLTLVLDDQRAATTALLQAVSPVDERVVWVSGHEGRWLRTTDGGSTWFVGRGPGGDSLQFRDVEAFGAATAYLLSAGTGPASRIYRTDDGGLSWRLQHVAGHPDAFLDCMAFWDRDTGVVYGDAVDGRLFVLRTGDGGDTWERVTSVPDALPGEGGFAASGTCARAGEGGRGWIATGNAERARVAVTDDRGRSWTAVDVPVVGGSGAGLAALAVAGRRAVALGGVLHADTARGRYVTVTEDAGVTWVEGGSLAKPGPVYGAASPGAAVAAHPPGGAHPGPVVVAVGPGGMDWSPDGGRTWLAADTATYWAVDFAPGGPGWAVGPGGRIVRIGLAGDGG